MPAALAWISYFISIAIMSTCLIMLYRNRMLASFAMGSYLASLILVRPAIIYLNLDVPWPSWPFINFQDHSSVTSLVGAAWMIIFAISAILSKKIQPVGALIFPTVVENPSLARLRFFCLTVTLIAVAATGFFVLQSGSLGAFIFRVKIEKDMSGLFVFLQIAVLSMIISTYGMIHEIKMVGSSGKKITPIAIYGALIVLGMLVSFAWGNRGNLAYLVVAIGLSWHICVSPLKIRKVSLIAASLVAAMFALGSIRENAIVEQTGVEFSERSIFREFSSSLHLVEFDGLTLALKDAGEKFDFRYGEDFWNGVLSVIPRSVMPNRENFNIGGWFRRVYEPSRLNGWPVTVIGDWYINFSYIGIIFGAIISGIVGGLIDGAYRKPRQRAWDAVLASSLGLLMMKGGVGTGFPQQIALTIIPLTLFSLGLRVSFGTDRSRTGLRRAED